MPCKGEDCAWGLGLTQIEDRYVEDEYDPSRADEAGPSRIDSDITLATLQANRSLCDGEPCTVQRSFALRAIQLAKDPVLFSLYDNVYNEK